MKRTGAKGAAEADTPATRGKGTEDSKVKAANDNRPGRRVVVLSVCGKTRINKAEVDVIDRLLQEVALTAANDNEVVSV